ncbi:Transcriptional activator FeaR [Pacificibacter marinus]|uniref:Transcriptional activator FeaR n=1 Tax=Pacificibacter marinus TaxID=658057 RepID=A0A1Y5TQR1_9RHOB|nr:acetamidase/formamidase family protein [Pacificibacter marinus]SLN67535.1 Transcriptional activator FeaR [Pacificibacter marinus]
MIVNPKHLDLSTLPGDSKAESWRTALAKLGLMPAPDAPLPPTGLLSVIEAGSGLRIARLIGPAQVILPIPNQKRLAPLLLILTLRSRGRLSADGQVKSFAQNDLAVVDQGQDWRLRWFDNTKVILLELPHEVITRRLGHQKPKLPLVLSNSIATDMVRAMLTILGTQLDDLNQSNLTISETALVDLICSALADEADFAETTFTQVQVAHFQRVSMAIDEHLSRHELSIAEVAKQVGLSVRYVQRLFELNGGSFSRYVRRKRLERSRSDLMDRTKMSLGVAQIAHSWGFSNSAHFSRAFRDEFGISPRELRDASHDAPLPYTFRGHPGSAPASLLITPSRQVLQGQHEQNSSLPVPSPGNSNAIDFVLPVRADTVHWGHISKANQPALFVPSDSVVKIETLTQHGGDDYARFIKDDPGAESIFMWTDEAKAIDRRGAGPMNASIFGRGAGEGFGVHICTGPIHVIGAEPGDVLEVQILDIAPRPCANPQFHGKAFGSNASAWWGYQYNDPLKGTARHETITIFEVDLANPNEARPLYQYLWTPQTDPFGVVHTTMDYPGIPVDHKSIDKCRSALDGVTVPARPHFGFVGVAPREAEIVDSIPPGYFGGNFDNWRAGPGTSIYLPVAVAGALLSIGDGHFSQGDGEVNGTGLEMSLTGTVRVRLHKSGETTQPHLRGLCSPLVETSDLWVIQSFSFENHLRDLGSCAQTDVYTQSTVDLAMRNAFRQTRRFLMDTYNMSEDDAHALMSVAVDFSVTQVADGNFGVHATVRKSLFNKTR